MAMADMVEAIRKGEGSLDYYNFSDKDRDILDDYTKNLMQIEAKQNLRYAQFMAYHQAVISGFASTFCFILLAFIFIPVMAFSSSLIFSWILLFVLVGMGVWWMVKRYNRDKEFRSRLSETNKVLGDLYERQMVLLNRPLE